MAGSIQNLGNGKYRIFVSAGTGSGGKRKRYTKTITASSDLKAEKELAKFVASVDSQNFVEPSKITLEQFINKWMQDYGEKNLSLKTQSTYMGMLDKRIIPSIGHLQLNKLKPLHIVEFINEMYRVRLDDKKKPISDKTVYNHYRLLNTILNAAVRWRLLDVNPVTNVDPPKYKKAEAKYYTAEDIQLMFNKLQETPLKYQVSIILAIATGLRLGELVGLKWENINFKNNYITISKAKYYTPQNGTFMASPKSQTSNRKISIPVYLVDLLKLHKSEQDERAKLLDDKWIDSRFILTQWNGNGMHPETPSKWWKKFVRKNGLKEITFHQLRHTSATILMDLGLNIKAISKRLGHASTEITSRTYVHAVEETDKIAAEKIGELLFKKEKRTGKKVYRIKKWHENGTNSTD
ncbi:MAG: tyrosine-type recombinase/integrase [Eubacteriaceae bacterium]